MLFPFVKFRNAIEGKFLLIFARLKIEIYQLVGGVLMEIISMIDCNLNNLFSHKKEMDTYKGTAIMLNKGFSHTQAYTYSLKSFNIVNYNQSDYRQVACFVLGVLCSLYENIACIYEIMLEKVYPARTNKAAAVASILY